MPRKHRSKLYVGANVGEDELLRFDQLAELEGYFYRREGARLAYLAARVPKDQAIVELGSFKGKSTTFLAKGSRDGGGAMVHAVDLWDLGGQGEYIHLGFDKPETLEAFRSTITDQRVKSLVREHQGSSAEVGQSWAGHKVGLLHIDGDHRAEMVRADLEAWLPHMAPGGWVAFHDYSPQFPGVVEVVDELVRNMKPPRVTRIARLVAIQLEDEPEPEEPDEEALITGEAQGPDIQR